MANELAERLKRRMEELRLSEKALSERAGLSPTYVKDIRRGRSKKPREVHLAQIARVLGMTLDELLDERPRQTTHVSRSTNTPETIADRLRAVLVTTEASEAEFAAEIGVPLTLFREWLAGTKDPSHDAMERLCDVAGVTLDWLYRGNWDHLWRWQRALLRRAMYGEDHPGGSDRGSSERSSASLIEPTAAAGSFRRV